MARAARVMVMATKVMARSRVMAMVARAMAMATRVAGECANNGKEEGNGDSIKGGGGGTAMRVAGDKEGTCSKGMAMAMRELRKQW
jgi:hypothetical protein